MKGSKIEIQLVAIILVLGLSAAAIAQERNASSRSLSVSTISQTRNVADGQQLNIEGIVTKREADSFTLRGPDGVEIVVVLTDKTNIKTVRKGLFRRDKDSGVGYILRGLRLKAEGRGNSDGQLVAEKIRFDEADLRTAQALESRVDPVETLANSTQTLAESNQKRIDEAEQNAQRLSGQVEELSTVAGAAGEAAKNAQATADQAEADVIKTNERINSLDDYDVLASITVHFKPGSALLSPEARAEIDELANSIGESRKGWIVAVEGHTDATGKVARNHSLSERRANAVINYLVTKHNLPPRRVVQPFGYGSVSPAATNETREGRAMNRRVEIRVLVNKGVAEASL